MEGRPDDELPPLGYLLVRIGEAVDRRFVAALEDLGLRPRQLRLLVLASAAELNQRELAAELGVDPGNLVGTLSELEADGLLVRRRGDPDRRNRIVGLTPRGSRLLARALQATAEVDHRLLDALPHADRERYREMTASIHRGLRHSE